MGSDWMAQIGMTAQPQNYAAGLAGESVGGVAPILAEAKATNIIEGLLALGNRGNHAINTVAIGLQSSADLGKMDTLASKFVGHEPVPQPQRIFNVDYPQATGGSPGSRLATSIDGDPLSSTSLIAGRRVAGGSDEGLSRVNQNWIAGNYDTPIRGVPQSVLGTDVGRIATTTDRRSGDLLRREIQFSNELTARQPWPTKSALRLCCSRCQPQDF